MFFNNTLEQVKQQVNFCSYLHYGSDYFNMPNVANATMHYSNSYFSFSDHMFLVIIDCSDEPWNKTLSEEESINYYDQCQNYLQKNGIE